MPNREELERLDLNMLAMYCLRVTEADASESSKADQARKLKMEWGLFIGHTKPPIPGLETPEEIEAYGARLKERMVEFLAGCFQSEALTTPGVSCWSDGSARGAAGGGN